MIEEANAISIALDKKVVFTALPVSASARLEFFFQLLEFNSFLFRGEYDGKVKVNEYNL